MELRLWEYGSDDKYIQSFLESASLAHKQPIKSTAWFKWKFEQSPYGKAILACAFDGDIVAGCVALGLGVALHNQREIKCALSYETFVNPKYQGCGLFKKLITLAEESSKALGVEYLYNFPNTQSLPGFKRMGWLYVPKEIEYRIKVINFMRFVRNLKSIKQPFSPNKQNPIINDNLAHRFNNKCVHNCIMPLWSEEYIKWRFIDNPQAQYIISNDPRYFAIARVGYRGELKECQILLLQHKEGMNIKQAVCLFSKYLDEVENPDFISICCTSNTHISHDLKHMIKVPTRANFTYKCLSDDISKNVKLIISGIDFHTY